MNEVFALLRKQVIESRWLLGASTAAFLGLSVLSTWLARRFETLIDAGEAGPAVNRYRFLRALGGPAMDWSTTALEVCWWNHPVIVLTVLSWAISRGSAAVSGEIERGTIDVTLSRPISRSSYLATQVLFAFLGLIALTAALVLGNQVGALIFTLKAPPTVATLLKPAANVLVLGLAVYGYTLPFSTVDVVRWRPTLASASITLGGLVAMSLAPQFPDYAWIDNLSVFQWYWPVTVALKGEPLGSNASVLLSIFAVGTVLSFLLFSQRDLPSNS